jgi:hypothetical protein
MVEHLGWETLKHRHQPVHLLKVWSDSAEGHLSSSG